MFVLCQCWDIPFVILWHPITTNLTSFILEANHNGKKSKVNYQMKMNKHLINTTEFTKKNQRLKSLETYQL